MLLRVSWYVIPILVDTSLGFVPLNSFGWASHNFAKISSSQWKQFVNMGSWKKQMHCKIYAVLRQAMFRKWKQYNIAVCFLKLYDLKEFETICRLGLWKHQYHFVFLKSKILKPRKSSIQEEFERFNLADVARHQIE